ncbi:MAG: radical SAM protein [Chitinophagaceae bacterium]|nr:radical SAM protein [Chitinophagaceae bacterium]
MCQKSSIDDNPYKKPKSMDFEVIEREIKLHHKRITLIQLIGGEPLLFNDFLKIIKLLEQYKVAYFITTNGALLNSDISKVLIGKCLWISFSLDAVTPAIYRHIRVGGSIHKVTQNLLELNQLKITYKQKLPILNANATLFSYNIDDLENLISYCKTHSIHSLSISGGRIYNTPLVNESHLLKMNKQENLRKVESAKRYAHKNDILLRVALRSLYVNKTDLNSFTNRLSIGSFFEITIQPDFTIVDGCNNYNNMGNLHSPSWLKNWEKYLSKK